MIQLYHVTKRYSEYSVALADVSCSVEKGEFVFLTGASGAGKTTLLKLLLRKDVPSEGQILVNGRNIAAMPRSRIPFLRRSMGVVFQDFKLLQRKTIMENVSLVLRLQGLPAKELKSKAYQALKRVGLHHKLSKYPLELSGGEQQRVAIARALINEPSILLADEPTGNLDPDLALEIMDLFRETNNRGTTVIVATHHRELIEHMGRRTLLLDHGRLIS